MNHKGFVLIYGLFLVTSTVLAGSKTHWGYDQENGSADWAKLSPDYALCGEGRQQSPVDLRQPVPAEQPEVVRDYKPVSLRIRRHEHVVDIIDNGHTIQVNDDQGSTLRIGETLYELKQYHFHAPSEHSVDGRHFPMEMHLVHQSAKGELAVLGVFIAEGAHNPAFDPVWANLPRQPGQEVHLEHVTVNVGHLLPERHQAYRYRGSLTTPPCSEGVRWLVASHPIALSTAQIAAFTSIFLGNNRPVQPTHTTDFPPIA
jgi:carbonic anhydrase